MAVNPTEDPVDRFKGLISAALPHHPALSAPALEQTIQGLPAGHSADDEVAALTNKVVQNSPLTVAQAQPVVAQAVAGKPDASSKAAAVSDAVASAAGLSGTIQLSDPVMLAGWFRVGFAAALWAITGACVGGLIDLADSAKVAGDALIGLLVLGVLALVAVLVLVMGYKNVTIKGGPSSDGSTGSS